MLCLGGKNSTIFTNQSISQQDGTKGYSFYVPFCYLMIPLAIIHWGCLPISNIANFHLLSYYSNCIILSKCLSLSMVVSSLARLQPDFVAIFFFLNSTEAILAYGSNAVTTLVMAYLHHLMEMELSYNKSLQARKIAITLKIHSELDQVEN